MLKRISMWTMLTWLLETLECHTETRSHFDTLEIESSDRLSIEPSRTPWNSDTDFCLKIHLRSFAIAAALEPRTVL